MFEGKLLPHVAINLGCNMDQYKAVPPRTMRMVFVTIAQDATCSAFARLSSSVRLSNPHTDNAYG